jgi:D-sedoheptulose 7-phosphate isomerase
VRPGLSRYNGPVNSPAAQALLDARAALDGFASNRANAEWIDHIAALLAERFSAGRKVLICGNGGSACDAMHFAEELTGRFKDDRPALPAIACTDPGHITCTANDYGFEHVFARWVEALGKKGDVLIVLSTSGNSPNLIAAVKAAEVKDMQTVGLLGRGGGQLQDACEHEIVVPGATSDRIQELHMLILHALVGAVEGIMFA